MNSALVTDGYKVGHVSQFPEGMDLAFNGWTARSSRVPGVDKVVFFGLQYFIKRYLIDDWQENFFSKPKSSVVAQYKERMDSYLGKDSVPVKHIEQLHDLGYLPLHIMALPEGSLVPIKVPMFVTYNTHPCAYWLPNYLETSLSATIWGMITSATTAFRYRQVLENAAALTGGDRDFVKFQGHDFSMRGMFGIEAGAMSGAAHLTSFLGTDTLTAIELLRDYYDGRGEALGFSVPATEHSVMCSGGKDEEFETFERLIMDVYPKGIVSIVSDTWDFWKVVTEYLPAMKDKIMARDGKVVIRPDSGDPVDILCGYSIPANDDDRTAEDKGLVECLWDIFGGTVNERGFKQLDPHIGAIYGDSITVERAQQIVERLAAKGFASTNVVLGIGSYTYQYATRDTYGQAMKATYCVVNDEGRAIFKDPKTDNGTKKSARGLMAVYEHEGSYRLQDMASWSDVFNCAFATVFVDGVAAKPTSIKTIRDRINSNFK